MITGEHFNAYRQYGLDSHAAAITFATQFGCLTALCLYSFSKNVRAIWLLLFLFTLSRTCAFFLRATLTNDHRIGRGVRGLHFWMFYQALYCSGIAALVSALYLCVLDHAERASSFMPALLVRTFRLNKIVAHGVLAFGLLFVVIGTSVSNYARTRMQRANGHNLYQASFMFYTFLLINLTWQTIIVWKHLPSKRDRTVQHPTTSAIASSNGILGSSKHYDTESIASTSSRPLPPVIPLKPTLTREQIEQATLASQSRWPLLFLLGNITLLLIREAFFLTTWNDSKAQNNELYVFNLATMPELLAVCCFLPKGMVLQRWALGRTKPLSREAGEADKEKNVTENTKKPKPVLPRFFVSKH